MMCHDLLFACGHLTGVVFVIRVCIENHRVCILSLYTIGCGMRWHDVTKNSFTFSCDSYSVGIESVALHLRI